MKLFSFLFKPQSKIADPFNLSRFVGAQESFYKDALREIQSGRKEGHWIWFIFPQMKGLGCSPMSQNYGITSIDEARAYLANPVLKSHLIEITKALLQHKDKTAFEILGSTDAIKVRSCMTLFDLVEPNSIFADTLATFYNNERDELTLNILNVSTTLKDSSMLPCLGAIIGDTIGSVYEFDNIKTTKFPLFQELSRPTDDSVMTIAVADWLANTVRSEEQLIETLVKWGQKYPYAGYGGSFCSWLMNPSWLRDFDGTRLGKRAPYHSWGNGSAMRCSACGWVAKTVEEAIELGRQSAAVTHNHPEGLRGAEAVSAAIFLARAGKSKEEIRDFIEQCFYYDLHMDCDEIRPNYQWEASCQGTVPPAIVAFLDSYDFESAIRLAVSLGGDCDTLTCITGGIAQAFYKEIPDEIISEMQARIPEEFWDIMKTLRIS